MKRCQLRDRAQPEDPETPKVLEGDPWGGWQEYFRRLLQGSRKMVIEREGEVLVLLRSASDAVECSDALDVDTMGSESRIGIMEIGTGEIGEEE